jgi:hypothetical protein
MVEVDVVVVCTVVLDGAGVMIVRVGLCVKVTILVDVTMISAEPAGGELLARKEYTVVSF